MRIKIVLWGCFICTCFLPSAAQTRMYLSVGTNVNTEFIAEPNLNLGLTNNSFSTGSYTTDYSWGKFPRVDLTIEKRFFGPYYWLTGIKLNQSGYDYAESVYISNLRNTYLSVPLLLRVNLYNANSIYIDLGIMENYLLYANLKESFLQQTEQQNIAPHLSRFSTSFYFELGFAFRRWGFAYFSQLKSFGSSSDFSNEWGLNQNRSLFLLYYQNFHFQSNGLKITCRIR